MPELPEVETVRRGAAAHLPGRRLRRVTLRRDDLRFPIPVAEIRALVGSSCTAVHRRSKYLLVEFDERQARLGIIHLGMSGRMAVDIVALRGARPAWRPHEHWRMDFGDRLVRFTDPRRFGVLDVVAADRLAEHRLFARLGPEPLEAAFDGEYLFARSRGRRTAVKVFVMDARIVVGVGNIYASEACFRAGVRPRRSAGRLTRAECARLCASIKDVLGDAIRAGGTTLRDYVGVDESTGWFQRHLGVYGRAGQPCPSCRARIKRVLQANRSTYYCPDCQR